MAAFQPFPLRSTPSPLCYELGIRLSWALAQGGGDCALGGRVFRVRQIHPTAAQVRGRLGPGRFSLVRDAGRLDCSGMVGNLSGTGACTLTANPTFTAYLQAHSIARPDERRLFSLAMSGVGRELIDAMERLGYVRPTVDQLVSMGVRRASSFHPLQAGFTKAIDLPFVRESCVGPLHTSSNGRGRTRRVSRATNDRGGSGESGGTTCRTLQPHHHPQHFDRC
jgi:hypothetical protein